MRIPYQSRGIVRAATASPFHFDIIASRMLSRRATGGLGVGLGGGIFKPDCFECEPCERCIPFTGICWDSICCEIVDCE